MKSSKLVGLLSLLLLGIPSVHAACTNSSLAGTFGFTITGLLILPTGAAPVGSVGAITFDLNGSTSGSQDRSLGGVFAHETLSGTFTINSNCTVNTTINVHDSSGALVRTSTIDGVLVNNGKQIRAIFESVTLPNGTNLPSVLTVEGERIQGHQ